MKPPTPSEELLAGRRALDGLLAVELIDDWRWEPDLSVWSLQVRLAVDPGEAERVPRSTDWYLLVSPTYPLGAIEVYPAKTGGITQTYHHQYLNQLGDPTRPWRTGNICADTGARGLERHAPNNEPWDARHRLKWYVQRALGWLEAAACDDLMRAGEPFELPHFPQAPNANHTIAFNEDQWSFEAWQAIPHSVGLFEYAESPSIRQAALVQRFLAPNRKILLEAPWSQNYRSTRSSAQLGVWIRLPQLPVLDPWQSSTTWGELTDACASYDLNLMPLLESASHLVRDGNPHVGLLGFPIPRITGEQPILMHWQAFVFPGLAHGAEHPKGFRPNKKSQWRIDRRSSLSPERSIEWRRSANWAADEISSRGRVPERVRGASIAMIGAGALGSVMSELLVRAGIADILIMDGDTLEIGNLVRHSLTMSDLGRNKAEAVAARLQSVSPNVQVDAIRTSFPPRDPDAVERLNRADVIIDTTGSDEVIAALELHPWLGAKLMISASLGLGAMRMYIYAVHDHHFASSEFHHRIGPLLDRDAEEWAGGTLPWEAVGCWNPVFPARVDDVWLLAAAAAKRIIDLIEHPPAEPQLTEIEQSEEHGVFAGVSIR